MTSDSPQTAQDSLSGALERLRVLATAAEHRGPWRWTPDQQGAAVVYTGEPHGHIAEVLDETDAEFIAAANPETILALLDVVERAQRAIPAMVHAKGCRVQLDGSGCSCEVSALRDALSRLEQP